jgi:hypothetical protein
MKNRWWLSAGLSIALAAAVMALAPRATLAAPNTSAPTTPAKLVFIHHSTGQDWLKDDHGDLGKTLGANNYFVSDTNYGWGPDGIGNNTDVGHWWTWFRGPSAATYTSALYANSDQNCSYTRTLPDPGGANTVIMFKSCYPNSQVGGTPSDAIPAIGSNPLAGNGTNNLTVGNAKGVYVDLVEYFKLHPEKLFVLVVTPPEVESQTNATKAANMRVLANWLVDPNGFLGGYAANNVFVFDYFTILTGGHHRILGGAVQHTAGSTDYSIYGTDVGNSHPNATGDQLATAEFVPMLNAAYNAWRAGTTLPSTEVLRVSVSRTPKASSLSYKRRRGVARFKLGATLSTSRGRLGGATVWLQKSTNGRSWKSVYKLRSNSSGNVSKRLSVKRRGVGYYRWYVPSAADRLAAYTAKQRVRVK